MDFIRKQYVEKKPKKKRIKNKHYNLFLEKGLIEPLEEKELKQILDNIKHKSTLEARALLIVLYYTGARPCEVLEVKAKDIEKKGSYVTVFIKGDKKGSLPRTIHLPYRRVYVKEMYIFASSIFYDRYLFYNFRSRTLRKYKDKTGNIREYIQTCDKVYYWVKKWSECLSRGAIVPYFLRHNRFSKLMLKGATDAEVRQIKGARSLNSVLPYVHLSTAKSKKLAGKMD